MAFTSLAAAIMALLPVFEQTLDTTIIVNDTHLSGLELKEWKREQACGALGISQCDFPLGYFQHVQPGAGTSEVMDFTLPNGRSGSICFLSLPPSNPESHGSLSYLDHRMPNSDFIYENTRAAYTPSGQDTRAFTLLMQITDCAGSRWTDPDYVRTLNRDIAFSALFLQLAEGDPGFLAEGGDTAARYITAGMRSEVGMQALGTAQRILAEHWKSQVATRIRERCRNTATVAASNSPLHSPARPIGSYEEAEMSGRSSVSYIVQTLEECREKEHYFGGSGSVTVTDEFLSYTLPSYPKLYSSRNPGRMSWSEDTSSVPGHPGYGEWFSPPLWSAIVSYQPFEVFGGDPKATLSYAWKTANQLAGM